MHLFAWLDFAAALAPALLMFLAAATAYFFGHRLSIGQLWSRFIRLAYVALGFSAVSLVLQLLPQQLVPTDALPLPTAVSDWLQPNLFGAWVSLLVQFLGTAIGVFSSKHLRGERNQTIYVAALSAVLAFVHVLLLANHWLVLIVAWGLIGWAMHFLLCFYPDRPFALLAAHKKRVADRITDVLLLTAAALAWWQVGSGSLSTLWHYVDNNGSTPLLQASALCLALAVVLRTALLPVHGWLIQVMEAPTPVSALLHAGVVNLSGYVLVLFAPLLEVSSAACWLLILFGLASAVLGGIVMLTRVSIKVHLAWSTLGQMGFMLLECGLGLYALAALHLLGHSLYKAHSFLSASSQVRRTRLDLLQRPYANSSLSLLVAPFIALAIVVVVELLVGHSVWPSWWSGVLALAWAPLLWLPKRSAISWSLLGNEVLAITMVVALTAAAMLVDYLPLGAELQPFHAGGWVAFTGMLAMYVCYVVLQCWPHKVVGFRHWIYAGFYLDEIYTIWALKLWPTNWANAKQSTAGGAALMNRPLAEPPVRKKQGGQ